MPDLQRKTPGIRERGPVPRESNEWREYGLCWSCFTPQLPIENYSHQMGTGGIKMPRVSATPANWPFSLFPYGALVGQHAKSTAAPISMEALLPAQ